MHVRIRLGKSNDWPSIWDGAVPSLILVTASLVFICLGWTIATNPPGMYIFAGIFFLAAIPGLTAFIRGAVKRGYW